jgi:hypothetical protein
MSVLALYQSCDGNPAPEKLSSRPKHAATRTVSTTAGLISEDYLCTMTLRTLVAGRPLTPTLSPSGGEEKGEGVMMK